MLWVTARQARELGLQVVALHVHHGLQQPADAWAEQARSSVERLAVQGLPVRLRVQRLSGQPQAGDSVEAWARRGRYAALAAMAKEEGAGLVLLAQHAEDQAETVLLQALRGAGPAGLAAMPARWDEQGVQWARPWLQQPRRVLQAVLAQSGLQAVEDPSNQDPRYARSRLRQGLMPRLVEDFPQAVGVLGEVARHAAQARALADEIAALDLPACRHEDGGLRFAPWSDLSPARRRNALAAWLAPQLPRLGAPVALLDRLCAEWTGLGRRWPIPGGGWLRSVRGILRLEASPPAK